MKLLTLGGKAEQEDIVRVNWCIGRQIPGSKILTGLFLFNFEANGSETESADETSQDGVNHHPPNKNSTLQTEPRAMQDSSANKLQSNTNSSGNMSRSPEGALRPTPIKIEVSFGLEEV